MVRRYTEPRREDFDTEEEWLEEMSYYDAEMQLQELAWEEKYYERR